MKHLFIDALNPLNSAELPFTNFKLPNWQFGGGGLDSNNNVEFYPTTNNRMKIPYFYVPSNTDVSFELTQSPSAPNVGYQIFLSDKVGHKVNQITTSGWTTAQKQIVFNTQNRNYLTILIKRMDDQNFSNTDLKSIANVTVSYRNSLSSIVERLTALEKQIGGEVQRSANPLTMLCVPSEMEVAA